MFCRILKQDGDKGSRVKKLRKLVVGEMALFFSKSDHGTERAEYTPCLIMVNLYLNLSKCVLVFKQIIHFLNFID